MTQDEIDRYRRLCDAASDLDSVVKVPVTLSTRALLALVDSLEHAYSAEGLLRLADVAIERSVNESDFDRALLRIGGLLASGPESLAWARAMKAEREVLVRAGDRLCEWLAVSMVSDAARDEWIRAVSNTVASDTLDPLRDDGTPPEPAPEPAPAPTEPAIEVSVTVRTIHSMELELERAAIELQVMRALSASKIREDETGARVVQRVVDDALNRLREVALVSEPTPFEVEVMDQGFRIQPRPA